MKRKIKTKRNREARTKYQVNSEEGLQGLPNVVNVAAPKVDPSIPAVAHQIPPVQVEAKMGNKRSVILQGYHLPKLKRTALADRLHWIIVKTRN